MRIAVIEDNAPLASGIAHALRDQGHAVDILPDGELGLDYLQRESADLVILDITLPGIGGLDILRALRGRRDPTPVLILTARGATKERVEGLDAGADDYLVKPFEMAELEARIRALLRRRPAEANSLERIGRLEFDKGARLLLDAGEALEIPRRELAVFECLLDRRDKLVPKSVLADHLYGSGADVDERVVEVYISRLRKRLKAYGISVKTARGLGYMLRVEGTS